MAVNCGDLKLWDGNSLSDSNMAESLQKRRGSYLQFLSDPLSKIPRSTFYDWRKKRNIVTETAPGSEIDLDVESSEPSSESELEARCLEQTRDASNLQSATLSSDSESSSNEDYFENVVGSGAYSARSHPNAEHDNPNVNGSGELDLADLFPEDEGEVAEDVLLDDVYDLDSEQEDLENLQNYHKESCLIADEERKLLYQGAPITLGASLLLVMTFAVRHGLSGVALTDLLILIELHCITPNLCRTSMKLLRDFFKRVRCPVELGVDKTWAMAHGPPYGLPIFLIGK